MKHASFINTVKPHMTNEALTSGTLLRCSPPGGLRECLIDTLHWLALV